MTSSQGFNGKKIKHTLSPFLKRFFIVCVSLHIFYKIRGIVLSTINTS